MRIDFFRSDQDPGCFAMFRLGSGFFMMVDTDTGQFHTDPKPGAWLRNRCKEKLPQHYLKLAQYIQKLTYLQHINQYLLCEVKRHQNEIEYLNRNNLQLISFNNIQVIAIDSSYCETLL